MALVLTEHKIIVFAVANQFVSLAMVSLVHKACAAEVDATAVVSHAENICLAVITKVCSQEITLSVLIPNSSTVVPARLAHQFSERFPRTASLWSRSHEITFIGSAKEYIETTIMITQRTSPNARSVTVHLVPVKVWANLSDVRNSIASNLPVHQIG